MSSARENKKMPAIRFAGFGGEWEENILGDVVDFYDEQRKPIESGIRETGSYPYYGASGIIDYVKDYLFDEELILLSEDGANIIDRNYRVCFLVKGKYWVNNHAHVLKAKINYSNAFICEALERLNYEKYNTGTAQPKLNQEVCRSIELGIPNEKEQTKIGNYFQQLDTLIAQHQQKHDKLQNIKKALLEKCFPKQGEHTPELRFKGFSGAWEEKALGETKSYFTDGNYGEAYPSADDLTDKVNGVPFLRGSNLSKGILSDKNSNYITYEKHAELESGTLMEDDVVIAVRGSLGALGYVKKINEGWNINSQLAIIRTLRFTFQMHNLQPVEKATSYL